MANLEQPRPPRVGALARRQFHPLHPPHPNWRTPLPPRPSPSPHPAMGQIRVSRASTFAGTQSSMLTQSETRGLLQQIRNPWNRRLQLCIVRRNANAL